MSRRRGALVEWQPRTATGALDARELVELVRALETLKKRIESGSGVGDYGSNLHLLIQGLKETAARKALDELEKRVANEPQVAGPDVEAVVRRVLDGCVHVEDGGAEFLARDLVRALREAGVEA